MAEYSIVSEMLSMQYSSRVEACFVLMSCEFYLTQCVITLNTTQKHDKL